MTELTAVFTTHSDIEASVVQALLQSHGLEVMRLSGPPPGVFAFAVSPLGAANPGPRPEPSPYYPSTRRFGNPLHLDVEAIADESGVDVGDLAAEARALNAEPIVDRARVLAVKRAALERKRFGRAAVAFGGMAATILTAVYFIQLRYVQPAVLVGELDGLAAWTQFNPHGVFIALEEAGYLLMGVAFLFAGLALSEDSRVLRAVRTIFFLGFACVVTTFVALSSVYGFDVEYRFEIAAISIDWTVLIVTGALLAIGYRGDRDSR